MGATNKPPPLAQISRGEVHHGEKTSGTPLVAAALQPLRPLRGSVATAANATSIDQNVPQPPLYCPITFFI